jgi:hypothetical protein
MKIKKEDLERAKREFDVEFLLRAVRTNASMDQEARNYLAELLGDFIYRKIRRPAHRPAKTATQSVAETAKEFGVSVSFVYGCLSKYRNEIEEAWRYAEAGEAPRHRKLEA